MRIYVVTMVSPIGSVLLIEGLLELPPKLQISLALLLVNAQFSNKIFCSFLEQSFIRRLKQLDYAYGVDFKHMFTDYF